MVKVPIAGRVKTRLAREVGVVGATMFYRHAMRGVIARLARQPFWRTVLIVDPDSAVSSRMLPQGAARVFLVQLGPEQAEQGITATEGVRGRGREVRQQDQPLGLQRNGLRVGPLADPAQFQSAQRAQFEHVAPPESR